MRCIFATMNVGFIGFLVSFLNGVLCLDVTYTSTDVKESNRIKRARDYTRWRVSVPSTVDFVVKVLENEAFSARFPKNGFEAYEVRGESPTTNMYPPADDSRLTQFASQYSKVPDPVVPVAFRRYNDISDLRVNHPVFTKALEYPTGLLRTTLTQNVPNPLYDDNSIDSTASRKPTRTSSSAENMAMDDIDFTTSPRMKTQESEEPPSQQQPTPALYYDHFMGTTINPVDINKPVKDYESLMDENSVKVHPVAKIHPVEHSHEGLSGEDFSHNIMLEDEDSYKNNTILYDDNPLEYRKDEDNIGGSGESAEIPEDEKDTVLTNNKEEGDENFQSFKLVPGTQERNIEYPTKSGYEPLRLADCTVVKLRKLSFDSIRTLDEIYTQLNTWADETHITKIVDITFGNLTIMDNPIYMVIVDDPSTGQLSNVKRIVVIVAGVHGRDHHAVASAMYLLQQLIEKPNDHRTLLEKNRFWIIPVFNPDGYEYSVNFPNRRQWTKNLKQYWKDCKKGKPCTCQESGIRCTLNSCYGVNLDRNFEYQWIPAEELEAERPCGSLYAGERQLSEIETKALALFLQGQTLHFNTFITFKEGEVLGVMYPYSHTKNKRSFDQLYRDRAARAATAAYNVNGRPYVAGQTSEFLPLYAGGIEDWVDGHLGIENVYTVVLFRPPDETNSKLSVERVAKEAFSAMSSIVYIKGDTPSTIAPVIIVHADSAAVRQKPSTYVQVLLFYLIVWNNQ